MKYQKLYIMYFSLVFSFLLPITSLAASNDLPFFESNKGSTLNDQVTLWTDTINGYAPTVSFLISAIFTIMFLIGIVILGYSMITKTGQKMKFSTGLLIWTPISFFLIRLVIIFLFTIRGNDVTLLASDLISLIKYTGYYAAIGMVLIGLILYMFYRFIDHPEYGRWGKRLWVIAAALVFLTTLMPIVLGAA